MAFNKTHWSVTGVRNAAPTIPIVAKPTATPTLSIVHLVAPSHKKAPEAKHSWEGRKVADMLDHGPTIHRHSHKKDHAVPRVTIDAYPLVSVHCGSFLEFDRGARTVCFWCLHQTLFNSFHAGATANPINGI